MTETDLILKKIRDRMNELADTIATTRLSLEDYRFTQGHVHGLALIERDILDMLDDKEKSDE